MSDDRQAYYLAGLKFFGEDKHARHGKLQLRYCFWSPEAPGGLPGSVDFVLKPGPPAGVD